MAKTFPKTLLITKEKDGDVEYFSTFEDLEEITLDDHEGELVATYELKTVNKLEVTAKLTEQ